MTRDPSMPQFEEGDFAALVAGGLVVEDGDQGVPELHRLSRRISGQYVDVLAAYASAAFHGRATEGTRHQVEGALSGLTRLAQASEDDVLVEALSGLATLLPDTGALGGNRRRDFMRALSDWVLAFAALLEPADAARLRSLVSIDGAPPPLLERLADVRGIGPKRLQRLYCAGLFTVEAVAWAAPEDVAGVTGLPLALSARVVQAARDFAEEERRNLVHDLRRRSTQLRSALAEIGDDAEARRSVIEAALDAMNEIREALSAFQAESEES